MSTGRYFLIAFFTIAGAGYAQTDLLPDSVWNTGAAVWDTNRVNQPFSATPGGIATGRFFKGANDDTIRIVRFQTDLPWSDTTFIEIGTDTSTSCFGPDKFRIEKLYATPVYFLYSNPVAVGNVDNDQYTDILAACRPEYANRLLWIEWNPASNNWVLRDSIVLPSLFLNNIAIGDANNDGLNNEIFLTTCSQSIVRAVWNGNTWDTLTIPLDSVSSIGVAIGDVRPDLPGNEVYVAGHNTGYPVLSRLWMIRWNGSNWVRQTVNNFDWPLDNTYALACDVAVGDVDPTAPGNEIAVCFTHGGGGMPFIYHFHIAILGWSNTAWSIKTWHWDDPMGVGCNDIEIGDLIADNPGKEIIVTCSGSRLFWLAPNGSAWMTPIPGVYERRIAVGDINRFRNITDEMIIAGNTGYMEYESRDFANNIGVYYYNMHNKTSIRNATDTIRVVLFNAGSAAQSGFTVGYRFNNSPLTGNAVYNNSLTADDTGFIKLPIIMDFLGMDTLYVFTSLGNDAYRGNDTVKLHVEVYDESTYAATGFNARIFPPVNGTTPPYDWRSEQTSGIYMNWFRDAHPVYPAGPPLEGYAGARFNCYGMPRYQHARIRTPRFNIGNQPRRVRARIYSYYAPFAEPMDPETLIVEYSYNGAEYNQALKFIYDPSIDDWYVHDVELGDFPANTSLYVGVRATSGGGGCDFFIDSVRVYGTTSTGVCEPRPAPVIPKSLVLAQNCPNPFRQLTRINYGVPKSMAVSIKVYNTVGQLVKTLVNGTHKPGFYQTSWDGLDMAGRKAGEGVYMMRLSTPSAILIRKLVLVK
jgi:hypothetical protein